MAKKKNYYDISNILKTHAQYMILLGQRANGKSYQAKLTALKNAYENKRKFVYLRRWKEDIKTKAVESYFGDMNIHAITNGEYDTIVAWGGELYFGKIADEGKISKGEKIGKYCALNEYERYKSQTFVDYDYILYEEFITDNSYLYDEPRQLQQFVSTVARSEKLTVILIGNTLSRVCPYFSEWCLEGVLKQKQGTIEIYHFHTEKGIVDIAVEYCANADTSENMFFGTVAKQIISGEWDAVEVPKLPLHQLDYDVLYELLLQYQKFAFVIQLLFEPNNGDMVVFIYPFTGTRTFTRIITDEFSIDHNITNKLTDIKPERLIANCFALNKVCFADNLTGADFSHVRGYFNL